MIDGQNHFARKSFCLHSFVPSRLGVRHFASRTITAVRISILVAVAENGVIGRGGKLPWHLADDLKRFKQLTMGHTLIMGRKTWESIARPLPGRRMIVVSRQAGYQAGVESVVVIDSVNAALIFAESTGDDEAFIVGGAELYRETIPRADRLYITRVLADVDGDAFFPELDWTQWVRTNSVEYTADASNDHPYAFQVYERRKS
jgi:dihydrofolate reductase